MRSCFRDLNKPRGQDTEKRYEVEKSPFDFLFQCYHSPLWSLTSKWIQLQLVCQKEPGLLINSRQSATRDFDRAWSCSTVQPWLQTSMTLYNSQCNHFCVNRSNSFPLSTGHHVCMDYIWDHPLKFQHSQYVPETQYTMNIACWTQWEICIDEQQDKQNNICFAQYQILDTETGSNPALKRWGWMAKKGECSIFILVTVQIWCKNLAKSHNLSIADNCYNILFSII